MKKAGLILVVILLSVSSVFASDETRLLHQPDINGSLIVFVYAGDLWTVGADGGEARRLTTHPGVEDSPKFSPDGKWIAFSGFYDGNYDVFIISAKGGQPKRLTFHPGADKVLGWTNDGEKVLFRSARSSTNGYNRFFTVSVNGGFPEMLPIPRGELADYSPDGKFMAYNMYYLLWQSHWRRYRGGQNPPIWILDLSDYSHVEIPHKNARDVFPVWIGNKVYFLSDRNRTINLFYYDVSGKTVTELVKHDNFDIENLSGDSRRLVYECNGYIYLFDPSINKSGRLKISVPGDLINIRPHFRNVSRRIFSYSLSPTGKRAVFEAHGEILTVPAKKGDIRNLTQSVGANDRYPVWSPDGKNIAYFSDGGGEYGLCIIDQKAQKPPERISLKNPSFYFNPRWSPDSKNISYIDKHNNVWYVNLENKKPVKVDTEKYWSPQENIAPVWSPDSRWITYSKRIDNYFRAVFVYSLKENKSYQITDGMSDSFSPSFDPESKYLYFIASTNSGPSTGWLDMSSFDRNYSMSIYLAVLQKDQPSPLIPESDEEESPKEKKNDKTEKAKDTKIEGQEKEKEDKYLKIDFKDINQRIISLPVPARNYSNLSAVKGKVFYMERVPGQTGAVLKNFDFKERKAETFKSGIRGYSVSSDGKKLVYRAGSNYYIVSTSKKHKAGDGKLNLTSMKIKVDPKAEWKQMLLESWRINRDWLFDPGMHGVDWKAMWDRYSALLPYVAHRSDLTFLIREMIGELCIGHSFAGGGDLPDQDRVPGGLLGADYEISDGFYRIKKIYKGENWNPDLRAPLTEPGVNVAEGDYIIKVNGNELRAPANIYSLFENTSGKQVTLHVNSVPEEEGCRTVTVVPAGSERNLRFREWIEGNRKKVEELSGGKLGYVYMPNTGGSGFRYFNRYFFAQLSKKGIILDERFNGGGFAADYIIDMLDKPLMCYWAPRDGEVFTTPFAAVFGPKVMITNEYAGSGGDFMPWMFRERGVGKLVGTRTWGGLVGTSGYPPLMDGGRVTAPSFSYYDKNGKWTIENEGIKPDIFVQMTPAEVIKGGDPQLEKAVETALEELKANPVKKTPRPKYPVKK